MTLATSTIGFGLAHEIVRVDCRVQQTEARARCGRAPAGCPYNTMRGFAKSDHRQSEIDSPTSERRTSVAAGRLLVHSAVACDLFGTLTERFDFSTVYITGVELVPAAAAATVEELGDGMAKAKTAIGPRASPARKSAVKRKVVPMRVPSDATRLERLWAAIEAVRAGDRASVRTSKLLGSGVPKMAQKVIEEAAEVAIEGIRGDRRGLIDESVDLFYNLLALLSSCGVSLDDVWAEMDRREHILGMAEKLPKAPSEAE